MTFKNITLKALVAATFFTSVASLMTHEPAIAFATVAVAVITWVFSWFVEVQ